MGEGTREEELTVPTVEWSDISSTWRRHEYGVTPEACEVVDLRDRIEGIDLVGESPKVAVPWEEPWSQAVTWECVEEREDFCALLRELGLERDREVARLEEVLAGLWSGSESRSLPKLALE